MLDVTNSMMGGTLHGYFELKWLKPVIKNKKQKMA